MRISDLSSDVCSSDLRVRDFDPSLNKKVRALGLKMALSAKAKNGSLIVLDNLDVADGKTKVLAGQLEKLGLNKALFIDGDAVNVSFAKASSRSEARRVGQEWVSTCRYRV